MFTVLIEGLEELERHWDRAVASTLINDMREAVAKALAEGTEAARAQHRYQDRSGALTRSLHTEPVILRKDSVEGALIADTSYAGFVEYGTKRTKPYPYMAFAYVKAERVLEAQLEVAAARFARELENA